MFLSRFHRYQAECVIPWANEVLLHLTIALQNVQQLKDKVRKSFPFIFSSTEIGTGFLRTAYKCERYGWKLDVFSKGCFFFEMMYCK